MKKLPRFENYRIDREHFSLRNRRDEIFLEPRLLKLLDVLLQNKGEVLSKKELLATVWEEVLVNEDSLPRAVADLKRVLGRNFTNPPTIQTIRKVGYKLELNRPKSHPLKTAAKVLMYAIGGFIAFVILIRAINY